MPASPADPVLPGDPPIPLILRRSARARRISHLDARGDDVAVALGAQVPVGGQMLDVVAGSGRRVVLGADHVAVPGPADRVGARLQAYLKEVARDRLAGACDDYAARRLRRPARVVAAAGQ